MSWILENLQIVIFIAVAVIWVLRSLAGARAEEGGGRASSAPGGPGSDSAEAERTRQIQEEIRRRILARQRGETIPPPAPVTPPPLPVSRYEDEEEEALDDPEYVGEGPNRPMPTAAAHRQADSAHATILEQQRVLAEQLHALRAARAGGGSVVPASPIRLPARARAQIAAHGRSCRRELLRDLHEPTSLRRAILLKEILGPPLALQPRGVPIPRR